MCHAGAGPTAKVKSLKIEGGVDAARVVGAERVWLVHKKLSSGAVGGSGRNYTIVGPKGWAGAVDEKALVGQASVDTVVALANWVIGEKAGGKGFIIVLR